MTFLFERNGIMTEKQRKRRMAIFRVLAMILAVIMIIGVVVQSFMY